MVKAKALREGESLIVYPMPAATQGEVLEADCIQTTGQMVYITYTYHYVAHNAVLCWSFTNFSFLDRWPNDGVCRCMYDDDFALQLRQHTQVNVGCAVYAKNAADAQWSPLVMMIPCEAVDELASALEYGAVTVSRAANRYTFQKCESVCDTPAVAFDPFRLVVRFAESRFRYSLAMLPPVRHAVSQSKPQGQQALARTCPTPPTPQPSAAEPISSATPNAQYALLSTDPSQDVVQGLINALVRRRNYNREQAEQIVRAMIERRNSADTQNTSGPITLGQAYVEYQNERNGTHK
jgi:hypothetical protein